MANDNVRVENAPYTLGRGFILVKPIGGGDGEWLDFAHVKQFNINIATEILDHFSSRGKIKKLDRSTIVQQTGEGTMITDVPVKENLKKFFLSDTEADTSQVSATGVAKNDVVAKHNRWIDLGFVDVSNVVVNADGGTPTRVIDVDYVLNAKEGLIGILEDGAIANNDVLDITFDHAAVARTRIDAVTAANQKLLFKFIGDPAEGIRQRFFGFGNFTPNGDIGAINDEWQELSFTIKLEDTSVVNGLFEYEELAA